MARQGPRTLLAGILLLATAIGPGARAAEPRASSIAGRVAVARGQPMALEVDGAIELVALAPGASLLGFSDIFELRPGDELKITWRREVSGVKLAEVVEAAPLVYADTAFAVRPDEVAASPSGRAEVLLDARPEPAFRAGHLPGARSVPSNSSEKTFRTIDQGAAVVVYGESGRTGEGWALARRLLGAGYRNVRVLAGGVQGWLSRDRPLEIEPEAASAAMQRGPGWVVLDSRAAAEVDAHIPGAISSSGDSFRWQEFDGRNPMPPLLLVGADGADGSPFAQAERIRKLRSAAEVRPALRMVVLAGGFAAWRRAALPVEAGGASTSGAVFREVFRGEVSPAEFARAWSEARRGITFLDVRRNGPAPEGVMRIPLEELTSRLKEVPRDREVFVFCMVGERSRVAQVLLEKNGFKARFLRAPAPW